VNNKRGEAMQSRLHEAVAEKQRAGATAAEGLRQLDVAADDDKLDDPAGGQRS
jgi:hypothetical protein